jgi:D-glycero-alpha-D-manno-heptose-7-phosphate kinase
MIITRTPFRITLGGGGTDLPSYYSRYGGFIFAAALDKYMFISVNRPIVDDLVRVKYSRSEIVEHRDDLLHEIAREAMRLSGIERSLEISSMADVPAGTGLGSSSCYAVGLLHALRTLCRQPVDYQALAEEACQLEIDILGKPIGKQDQYMASFGGLTVLDIAPDGRVEVSRARISESTLDDLVRNLLIFYTGSERSSHDILSEQSRGVTQAAPQVVESLHAIKEMGYRIREMLERGNLTDFGLELDRHWQAKKRLSSRVSNPRFDQLYDCAKENGALGGKISGAGGGGFFVFYTERDQQRLRDAMRRAGLREMRYRFDFEGTKVVANLVDGTFYASTNSRVEVARA